MFKYKIINNHKEKYEKRKNMKKRKIYAYVTKEILQILQSKLFNSCVIFTWKGNCKE
jgi:hypothetical protein